MFVFLALVLSLPLFPPNEPNVFEQVNRFVCILLHALPFLNIDLSITQDPMGAMERVERLCYAHFTQVQEGLSPQKKKQHKKILDLNIDLCPQCSKIQLFEIYCKSHSFLCFFTGIFQKCILAQFSLGHLLFS